MSNTHAELNAGATRPLTTAIDDAPDLNSAVSWPAIFAGAAGAAALSLILLILGTGLGFSTVSPWAMEGISAATFGFAAIVWLSFTQLAASGMGGYLAGRLRNRWPAAHADEVFFRDTAHGFLAWAIATLVTVIVVTSVMGSIVGGGVRAAATVAGGAADSASSMAAGEVNSDEVSDTVEYFVDSLFRNDTAGSAAGAGSQGGTDAQIPVGEVTRIFARAMRSGTLPQEDERYLGQLIAQHTGLNQQQAQQRVSEGFGDAQSALEEAEVMAREAADQAREASAYAALWMFVTLLLGAFAASLLAVFGGRQRDA